MAIGGEFTHRLLKDAGIAAGMRVLDIGCGSGDVSLIAASMVGEDGAVTGIDRDDGPLETARERASHAGFTNTLFVAGDISAIPENLGPFDAIVGRRVLMYQPERVQALHALLPVLAPGGLVVLQEHDTTLVPACPAAMPLHRTVQRWMKATIEAEGADTSMGFTLHTVLTEAGLTVDEVRAEAVVQTPTQRYPVASIIHAMLPRILAHGVATEEEIDIDTLGERLEIERLASGATYLGDMMFGAIARHHPAASLEEVVRDHAELEAGREVQPVDAIAEETDD